MNVSLGMCFASLIGLSAMNSAFAVEQIKVADELLQESEVEIEDVTWVEQRQKGPTITAGIGAVGLPTINIQSEFHLDPKLSAVVGVQGIYGGFYITGAGSVALRHYITGDSRRGLYLEEGVHAGASVIAFTGGISGVGPHLGFGGKFESRNGFTVDINAGVTGTFILNQGPGVEFLPTPTASITFGKRLKR